MQKHLKNLIFVAFGTIVTKSIASLKKNEETRHLSTLSFWSNRENEYRVFIFFGIQKIGFDIFFRLESIFSYFT